MGKLRFGELRVDTGPRFHVAAERPQPQPRLPRVIPVRLQRLVCGNIHVIAIRQLGWKLTSNVIKRNVHVLFRIMNQTAPQKILFKRDIPVTTQVEMSGQPHRPLVISYTAIIVIHQTQQPLQQPQQPPRFNRLRQPQQQPHAIQQPLQPQRIVQQQPLQQPHQPPPQVAIRTQIANNRPIIIIGAAGRAVIRKNIGTRVVAKVRVVFMPPIRHLAVNLMMGN